MIYQVLSIIRTEFRLQWRRRGLLVMTLAMLVVSCFATLMLKHEIGASIDLRKTSEGSTEGLVSLTLIPVCAVVAMIMPFVMADAIPNDRHLGAYELLSTMPMSKTTYLLGKFLGVLVSVFSSITIIFVLTGILWGVLIGLFNLEDYLEAWFVAGLLVAVVNIGLSVLLAAPLSDAKRAVVMVVLVFVLIPALIGFDPRGNVLDSFNPLRPGIFYRYLSSLGSDPGETSVTSDPSTEMKLLSVSITLLTSFAQLALAWIAAQWWLNRQEG